MGECGFRMSTSTQFFVAGEDGGLAEGKQPTAGDVLVFISSDILFSDTGAPHHPVRKEGNLCDRPGGSMHSTLQPPHLPTQNSKTRLGSKELCRRRSHYTLVLGLRVLRRPGCLSATLGKVDVVEDDSKCIQHPSWALLHRHSWIAVYKGTTVVRDRGCPP